MLPDDTLRVVPPKEFLPIRNETQAKNEADRTVSTFEDDYAFAVLMTGQTFAGAAARMMGCFDPSLVTLAEFLRAKAGSIEDVEVLAECLEAWMVWEERSFASDQTRSWARRMLAVLPRLDAHLESIH